MGANPFFFFGQHTQESSKNRQAGPACLKSYVHVLTIYAVATCLCWTNKLQSLLLFL